MSNNFSNLDVVALTLLPALYTDGGEQTAEAAAKELGVPLADYVPAVHYPKLVAQRAYIAAGAFMAERQRLLDTPLPGKPAAGGNGRVLVHPAASIGAVKSTDPALPSQKVELRELANSVPLDRKLRTSVLLKLDEYTVEGAETQLTILRAIRDSKAPADENSAQ